MSQVGCGKLWESRTCGGVVPWACISKAQNYRLTGAHLSKGTKGAAASVVVLPAEKIKGVPAPETLADRNRVSF
jgi:hypothetical protein